LALSNWNWHRALEKVVNVRNITWWNSVEAEVTEWLEAEGIASPPYMSAVEHGSCPNIFLYTDEQIAYFTLRWGHDV